jgi:hypothetical protein
MAYMSADLAKALEVPLDYDSSTKKGRLLSGKGDVFRVGLGRPAKTLPTLFGDKTPVLRPKDPAARDNLMRCSFFRTWRGDSDIEKIVASIDAAYQKGAMDVMDELEYVTSFLRCEVIHIDTETNQVVCGFWSDSVGANSRTIAILGKDILGFVSRKKELKKAYKTFYDVDLRTAPFNSKTLPKLRELHAKACSVDVPVLKDAITELRVKGKADYQVILDPFKRIQAVFIPGEVILPIQPYNGNADPGVTIRRGYFEIAPEELPTGEQERIFLGEARHPKYKIRDSGNLQDTEGRTVELMLESGFRVPIQPEESTEKKQAQEVWASVQKHQEGDLVDAPPNADDVKLAEQIAYASEVYEFLMFSLSKDVAVDEAGEMIEPMYGTLRTIIREKSPNLLKELKNWFKKNAYEDTTKSPVEFVNKVRTPCGQYKEKDACNKSSLCGWHKSTCKIRVKPVVDKEEVLKRIAKTLRDNEKQRALVLDERLSPFFSTVLYLEMPHEWITTVV